MTHSFWAIMGGIGADGGGSEPFIPSEVPLKLTERGILFLLKTAPQLFPDVAEGEVKDKSKGDWLTKSLACMQATWFCMSCLVRVGQRLPLSLLELNTFAHAICTIIVYFIWWNKPLSIERPLLITSTKMRPLLAYMWMASKLSARPKLAPNGDTAYKVSSAPEFEAISLGRTRETAVLAERSTTANDHVLPTTIVTPSMRLANTNFFVNQSSARWTVHETYVDSSSGGEYDNPISWTTTRQDPAIFHLTPLDVRRWRLAHEALETYKLKKPNEDQGLVTIKPVSDTFDPPESTATDGSVIDFKQLWAVFCFCILAAAYGALHALAWNTRFPTRRQRILWRISSLIIASPAGAALIVVVLVMCVGFILHFRNLMTSRNDYATSSEASHSSTAIPTLEPTKPSILQDAHMSKGLVVFGMRLFDTIAWDVFVFVMGGLARVSGTVFAAAAMIIYLPARAYIVGESFRMVFYLPPDAFRATQWEKFFPHFG